MTAALLFAQHVNFRFEFLMRRNRAGLGDDLATLDVFLLHAAKQNTNVVAGARFIQKFAEHFDVGRNRFRGRLDPDNLDFLHFLEDAAINTPGRDSAAAFNVEYVFDRHHERLINRAFRYRNVIINRGHERENLLLRFGVAVQRFERAAFDDRDFVARKFVLREEIAHFHLDEIEKLWIIDHVHFVQEDNDRRHTNLAREQNVLAGLRHRTVRCAHDQNSAVHLGRAGNHVLDVVGVTGAIDVGIVTLIARIFHVRCVDRDAALFFLGGVID